MQLSTKSRYGVSAMFHLAAHGNGEPITAAVIAKGQAIPLAYLEQLLSKLRKAGLVKTHKGPSGGYALAKKPGQIRVGDIIRATDGPIALAHCVNSTCTRSGCCSTKSLWQNLTDKVSKVFDSTTLKDLCNKEKK